MSRCMKSNPLEDMIGLLSKLSRGSTLSLPQAKR
jgi:hypothetical protein